MELKEIWEKYNYQNSSKLWQIVKQQNLNYKYKDVQNFINDNELHQLHKKPTKQKSNYQPIVTHSPCTTWQIDLLNMQNYS